MKILIIYGTSEGQTRKIARFLEDVLQKNNHTVVIADSAEEPPSPHDFDVVLVGSSIHINKYQNSVRDYIKQYVDTLNAKKSAFFSVSLVAASDLEKDKKEMKEMEQKFLTMTEWQPKETFQIAGALKFTKYNFFERIIMRMIASKKGKAIDTSKDYEYTDWKAVEKFILDFVSN